MYGIISPTYDWEKTTHFTEQCRKRDNAASVSVCQYKTLCHLPLQNIQYIYIFSKTLLVSGTWLLEPLVIWVFLYSAPTENQIFHKWLRTW